MINPHPRLRIGVEGEVSCSGHLGGVLLDRADTAASNVHFSKTEIAADPVQVIVPKFAGIAAEELSDAD